MTGIGGGHAHNELTIGGMTCASCAARIEKKLNRLDGVEATRQLRHREGAVMFPPSLVAADADRHGRGRRATRPRCPQPPIAAAGGRPDPPSPAQRLAGHRRARRAGARCCRWSRRCSSTTGSGSSLTLAAPVVVWGALAVPPRGAGEPAPRRGDDGHARLARHRSPRSAGRSYALFLGDAGSPACAPVRAHRRRGAGAEPSTWRSPPG